MNFEIIHELPATPARAFEILFSEAYEAAFAAHSGHESARTLLEDRQEGPLRIRRYRIESGRELPALVAKAVGTSRLSYELQQTLDPNNQRMNWRVVPTVMADKVRAEGSYGFESTGPGTCRRIIRGQVTVGIVLVGKKIEDLIGRELEAGYAKSTEFARTYLESQG